VWSRLHRTKDQNVVKKTHPLRYLTCPPSLTPLPYGKAIEIVCKCNRARKVLTDSRLALFFLAQGAEHLMRQHEPLDVRLLSDLCDHRRRHMQHSDHQRRPNSVSLSSGSVKALRIGAEVYHLGGSRAACLSPPQGVVAQLFSGLLAR
jgi:hypothetical protein